MLNIAIIGFGFIGSGVADVFSMNESVISRKLGDTVNIKYILDINDIGDHPLADRLVKDIGVILNDPEISLIAETLPGPHPAYEYTKAALERGISVVTPNKAVVAEFGAELLKIAARTDARYFFEASVGGGIPIIRPMYNCLAANSIYRITAILNATTNFILTKMTNENLRFEDALAIAQELGYAERDPSSDVGGIDTCRKICILSSLAFGRYLPPEKVRTEGITGITSEDIKNAEKIGCKIKLVAISEKPADSDTLRAVTAPMLVSENSQLYSIEGVSNGIIITGNLLGDVMFCGPGAGKLPTASAVAADIIDALTRGSKNMAWEESDGGFVREYERCAYYIRAGLSSRGLDSAFNIIKETFADADIREANNKDEVFFITGKMTGKFEESGGGESIEPDKLAEKINKLTAAGFDVKSSIRIL